MGAFENITGQKRAAAILQRAIRADRVSHAWLLCGSSAQSRLDLALAFAQTLQCTGRSPEDADACMTCRSCLQAMDGNHPDIRTWIHEKPTTFSVDEVRSLIADVSIRPFQSERKIYIVPDAHLMRQEAQNALLKTLEEPPSYIVIILLGDSADAMLETIRSRCQPLELAAEQIQYDPLLQKTAENILSGSRFRDLPSIKAAVTELSPYKLQSNAILDLFASWYRDMLYFKATSDPNGILFSEHLGQIRSSAGRMTCEKIQMVLDAIRKARLRLLSNVNYETTMELLLLAMQDAES